MPESESRSSADNEEDGPRLFLYIDILGFCELIKEIPKVQKLYGIIDKAMLHRDQGYKAIVFSDTIVVYSVHPNLEGEAKATELMFLIELTQQLHVLLIGSGVFFRAVITEGDFHHHQLTNFTAFYGQALVETHLAEKKLKAIGLFLHRKLRSMNWVFRHTPFSDCEDYDFVYLTHQCSRLTPRRESVVSGFEFLADPDFPLPENVIEGPGSQPFIYPELVHFKEIHDGRMHPVESVRAKYEATWNLYVAGYPKLIRSLQEHDFAPEAIADVDWSYAEEMFREERGMPSSTSE